MLSYTWWANVWHHAELLSVKLLYREEISQSSTFTWLLILLESCYLGCNMLFANMWLFLFFPGALDSLSLSCLAEELFTFLANSGHWKIFLPNRSSSFSFLKQPLQGIPLFPSKCPEKWLQHTAGAPVFKVKDCSSYAWCLPGTSDIFSSSLTTV